MQLEFHVDWHKSLSRNMRILADGITSMKTEFAQIGQLVVQSSERNMKDQWSETGGRWKQLSPKTVQARSNRSGWYKATPDWAGPTGPILRWTGQMARGFRYSAGKDIVTIDNPVPHFKHHQSETRQKPSLPRRLMLELKQTDKTGIMSIIAGGLHKKLPGGNYGRQY